MRVLLLALCALVPLVTADHEFVVVTVATDNTDGLKRLLTSAETFNIKVKVLGLDEEWRGGNTRIEQGGAQKIRILRDGLKEYKDKKDTIIMFVDAYDVIFTDGLHVILDRFLDHYEGLRVLFGAEPYCWPDKDLANEYPLVEFGKRFLNSGLFMGYGPEVYGMLTHADVKDNDDDQRYFTHIYLDEELRAKWKIGLDSMSRIFQNLNGVVDDVELKFDDDGNAYAYNAAYNTHPVVVHGNGPSKLHLNYLANYAARRWSSVDGCATCGGKSVLDLENTSDDSYPHVALAVFIHRPIPFVEEALESFARQNYPKSRMSLYIYNKQVHNRKNVLAFMEKHGEAYTMRKVLNGGSEMGEREAREEAIKFAIRVDADYLFSVDADSLFTNDDTLKHLVEKALNYDSGIISPMMSRPGKLFSNFWGALADNGYYARSEDYLAIVGGKRVGHWNVPFVTGAILISKQKLSEMKSPYSYNPQLDPEMSFCQYARDHTHFMYSNNEAYYGLLIASDEYSDMMGQGALHPEMFQIFENRWLWESRYLHPKYKEAFEAEEVHEPCPDVFDYPLMSERFCEEMIEEMENFGRWSDGNNQDRRLAGGYENVPTRDIHMNQIGFERHWLYFVDEYVRPMQEKIFTGYFHRPVESSMMFVVRYKPEEQASLRPHHDASTFSIDIALNKKGRDYQGGGVRYVRYNCTVPADEVGYTMMFPGRLTHLHEGLPTTEGTRYILVSFLNP